MRAGRVIAVFAATTMGLLAGGVFAAVPDGGFAGEYRSDKLTVTLTAQGSGYTGRIDMGGRQYPITSATVAGDHLNGVFNAGGHAFPFDATLDGTRLTLTTGSTTYTLADDNPLDPPGGHRPSATADANPLAAGGATPPAAPAATGGSIVGRWAVSGDFFGGERYTLTFNPGGDLTIESADGSSSSGTGYKYADGKITFDGSSQMNKLSVGGTWQLKWQSADAFSTTDDQGRPIRLARQSTK